MKTSNRGIQRSVMTLALAPLVCGVVTRITIAEDFPALVTRLKLTPVVDLD